MDVFPNPARDRVTLNVGESWAGRAFQVWDVAGNLVTEGKLVNNMSIEVSEWSSGSYILTAAASHGKLLSRVLIVE